MKRNTIKVISKVGDVTPEEYGGGAIIESKWGDLSLEWTHGAEDCPDVEDPEEENPFLLVYSVPLDEPAITFATWVDVEECAATVGMQPDELQRLMESSDPFEIARAYETIAATYGWFELDNYPINRSYKELQERWEEKDDDDKLG